MAKDRTLRVPTGAVLSKYLRSLAVEVHTITPDGDPVSRASALAELVWRHALGHESASPDDPEKKIWIPPCVWAIELLYNRIEGKVPLAVVEDQGRSLADKVTDLARARANSLAKASTDAINAPDEGDEDGE